jgi:hypothetical protein
MHICASKHIDRYLEKKKKRSLQPSLVMSLKKNEDFQRNKFSLLKQLHSSNIVLFHLTQEISVNTFHELRMKSNII